jgi:hypothetical protein
MSNVQHHHHQQQQQQFCVKGWPGVANCLKIVMIPLNFVIKTLPGKVLLHDNFIKQPKS